MSYDVNILGEICRRIVSGGTPRRSNIEYYQDGRIPWLNTKEVDFTRIYSTENHITQAGLENSSAKWIAENSVIVAMYGATAGKAAINKIPLTTNQACCNLEIDPNKADYNYVYYFLKWKYRELANLSSGAAQQNLNLGIIRNFPISIPPLSTQKSIADTLSCLDAKIEVNNRIIKNLEEQAQAIFKSWFIDFEPFQEGEFVESELGMIPEGWKAGTIADLGEVVGGSTPSKKFTEYYSENGIAWITPKDLSLNKNKFVSRGQIDITQLGLKNSSARVMPKGTVLFSSRAPIGYIAIAKNEVTTNQGFKSVVPREDVGTEYVYHFLKNNVSTIEAVAGGSTFKEVSGTTMKQIPALIPSKRVLEEFKKAIHLHFQLQELLEEQNTTLATLRDTLLPKLMSGEIEVPIDQ